MKKIFKKLVAVVSAALIAFSFISVGLKKVAAETSDPTPIDMYLIAGQSNAAGYSTKDKNKLTETFENVGYGGEVQRNFREGGVSSRYLDFEDYIWGVKTGLGATTANVGPEYGIAKVLNAQYANRADGRKAFIFKTAAGGTSLLDKDASSGTMYKWGNWYPRSYWEDGYKPNTITDDPNNDATGYLYALFLQNFKHVYNELKDNGYAPVVKGLAWMQGCQDLGAHSQYEPVLKTFINDIRTDLVEITGDEMLYSMPFVIGKIATSFMTYENAQVPAFNQMQQRVADDMGSSVATIETSDLIIVNADGSYNGTDQYHFNCPDAEILGVRFGEKLAQLNGSKLVSANLAEMKNGTINYFFDEDGKLTVTAVPETGAKKYRLSKLIVNNADVTANVKNNVYVIENPDERTYISAEFIELEKYSVTYTMDEKIVGLLEGRDKVYVNDDLTIKTATKSGYEVTKVTANGAEIQADKNGVYVVGNVMSNVEIVIETKKIGANDSNDNSQNSSDEEKPGVALPGFLQGCFGGISSMSASLVLLCGAAVLLKKKR